MHYQLQLPANVEASDLGGAVAWRALVALDGGGGRVAGVVGPISRIAREVNHRLRGYLYAWDTCGLYRSCLDAARPAEWNPGTSVPTGLEGRHARTLMHLDLPDGLDALERELTDAVLEALGPAGAVLRGDADVRAELGGVIREAIGPYLFEGDLCEVPQKLRAATLVGERGMPA